MNAAERRTKITELLAASDRPMSATALAARCGVSRQIIVGDVALLRAGGVAVMATPRGYILENAASAPAYATPPPLRRMRNGASSRITMKTGCARSCTRSSIWAARRSM